MTLAFQVGCALCQRGRRGRSWPDAAGRGCTQQMFNEDSRKGPQKLEWRCIGQASCLEFHLRDLVREQRCGVPGTRGNNHLVNVGRVLAVLMMAALTHGSWLLQVWSWQTEVSLKFVISIHFGNRELCGMKCQYTGSGLTKPKFKPQIHHLPLCNVGKIAASPWTSGSFSLRQNRK